MRGAHAISDGLGVAVQDALVEAEFEVLRFMGVGIYRTKTLDGKPPRWSAHFRALMVGTDITPEEAEDAACELLGLLACS